MPSIMKNTKAKAPDAIRGRSSSGGGVEFCLKNIPPNTTIMKMGDSSMSFASGARRIDRRLATVITEACSDSPGILFSRNRAGYFAERAVDADGDELAGADV